MREAIASPVLPINCTIEQGKHTTLYCPLVLIPISCIQQEFAYAKFVVKRKLISNCSKNVIKIIIGSYEIFYVYVFVQVILYIF